MIFLPLIRPFGAPSLLRVEGLISTNQTTLRGDKI